MMRFICFGAQLTIIQCLQVLIRSEPCLLRPLVETAKTLRISKHYDGHVYLL